MVSYIAIIVIVIVLCAAAYYYFFMFNRKKMIALYSGSQITIILPELIKTNLTVTATPALQGATVVNNIGTPIITITGFSLNTLYTFSISGYDNSNPIYTGELSPAPTPTPVLTLTKTDASVTMTHTPVPNATAYQFLMIPVHYIQNNVPVPNPFTYYVSRQTNANVTFTNMTPFKYNCIGQATNAAWSTPMLNKEISFPLLINRPIIAICNTNYTNVNLYFVKEIDRTYTISLVTSVPSLPNNVSLIDSTIDNGLKIGALNANALYQFSINGISGTSNSVFMGQGNLESATVTPQITKVSATSFTVSINAVNGATSYQFVIYETTIQYLYTAVSQTTSSLTLSNMPYGTYVATIQASSAIGTKVGVSGNITIPQP
jgi:hypothetical protein